MVSQTFFNFLKIFIQLSLAQSHEYEALSENLLISLTILSTLGLIVVDAKQTIIFLWSNLNLVSAFVLPVFLLP